MGTFPAAKVLTNPTPKLADVQCHRFQFHPGDRVAVRVYQRIDREQKKKLKAAVEKWAGDVEVLIIDCTLFDIEILKLGDIEVLKLGDI